MPLDIFLISDTLSSVDNYVLTAGARSRFFFFRTVFPIVTRLLSESHPFQNQAFTKYKFRKSFFLIFIRIARGYPPRRDIRREHHEPIPERPQRHRSRGVGRHSPERFHPLPLSLRQRETLPPHWLATSLRPLSSPFQSDQTRRFPGVVQRCGRPYRRPPPSTLRTLSCYRSPPISRPPPHPGHQRPRLASTRFRSRLHHQSAPQLPPPLSPLKPIPPGMRPRIAP